jgi:hypothetical protein
MENRTTGKTMMPVVLEVKPLGRPILLSFFETWQGALERWFLSALSFSRVLFF